MDGSSTNRLLSAISGWIKELDEYPGWKEWNRRKIGKVLDYDDPWPSSEKEPLCDFQFDKNVEHQHAVCLGFLRLHQTGLCVAETEYYFRRYPFRGLPVRHYDHLNTICEMYFGRFYEFRSRLKNYLNLLNKEANRPLSVGPLLKMFDRIFDAELRARNSVDHRERFSDLSIDSVALISLVSSGPDAPEHLKRRMTTAYRKAAREWAARAKRRAQALNQFVEIIADAVLERCTFLGDVSLDNLSDGPEAAPRMR